MSKKLIIPKIETLMGKKTECGSLITHTLILDGTYKILFNHKNKGGNMMIYRHPWTDVYELEFNYNKHVNRAKFSIQYVQTISDVLFNLNSFMDLWENYYDKTDRNR
jgi:uncharacterized protein YozE (UPF0346 family)